ncbi:uncharacterized protein LOC129457425 [Periophthalmus magnuspinnatus]|uniref:uncharacterized protein LOC129457425 n=1 Tax=Periophthalmus magnuspinnatus TaxID=409849 RepID=UPI0024362DD8|nr:uncharacterized protein LOC129457425 [Periophthalmus magnuspinnatus]
MEIGRNRSVHPCTHKKEKKWRTEQGADGGVYPSEGENSHLFSGAKYSAQAAWKTILQKMGLEVTPLQAKKKWENLQKKYKDCKYPKSGEGVAGNATAETWPWFVPMDEVLGQRASINPPVLIASVPEDTPGPSTSWQTQPLEEEEEEEEQQQRRQPRKRKRENPMLQLYREDLCMQRERDERDQEEREERKQRYERLFGLLEKLIEKN